MRWLCVVMLIGVAASCARDGPAGKGGGAVAPEEGVILPEEANWKEGPTSLPAGAKFVVLEGDPSKAGYFAMRVWMPDGYRVPPHWYPVVERVTVISGTLRLGMGEIYEPGVMHDLAAGSYLSMPAEMRHFTAAKGETVIQIATLGPWAITYVNAADDPREKR